MDITASHSLAIATSTVPSAQLGEPRTMEPRPVVLHAYMSPIIILGEGYGRFFAQVEGLSTSHSRNKQEPARPPDYD